MGLCKCPRKKVTNLFCFQHRVNVCEHCLVTDHSQCVVQSYLRWLRDSDFSAVCSICNVRLDDQDCGECVRLMCLDAFHWQCLDRYCRAIPSGGDNSQYKCPTCQGHVFPAENVVSPLAEALRSYLSNAVWARSGLGMPEMNDLSEYDASYEQDDTYDPSISYDEEYNLSSHDWSVQQNSTTTSGAEKPPSAEPGWDYAKPAPGGHRDEHVVTLSASEVESHMRGGEAPPRYEKDHSGRLQGASVNGLHKVQYNDNSAYDTFNEQRLGMRNIDSHFRVTSPFSHSTENDDKYKRRTPALWTRINSWPRVRRCIVTVTTYRLFILIIMLCLIAVFILDWLVTYGRTMAEREPLLDPMANPNIRINSG